MQKYFINYPSLYLFFQHTTCVPSSEPLHMLTFSWACSTLPQISLACLFPVVHPQLSSHLLGGALPEHSQSIEAPELTSLYYVIHFSLFLPLYVTQIRAILPPEEGLEM